MLTAPKPNFADALRQADAAYRDHGVWAESSRRLRQRLEVKASTSKTPRWLPVGLGLAGAVCAAALAVFVLRGEQTGVDAEAPVVAAEFSLVRPSNDFAYVANDDGSLTIHHGEVDATSKEFGITGRNAGEATIRHERDGVRLVRGTARFDVRKRQPQQAPARVWVSHGRIEVLGTEFTIEQSDDGGDVLLHEGAIRFVGDDGQVRSLNPGERLQWPLTAPESEQPEMVVEPDTKEPTVEPVTPASKKQRTTTPARPQPTSPEAATADQPAPETRESVLDELAQLRSRGEYREAVRLLEHALKSASLSAPTGELLSYELGAILTHQLKDVAAACAHWQLHTRQFPNERYAAEISSSQLRLNCGGKHNE